jgi:hypothetical protein
MHASYLWLTPIAVVAIVSLLCFVGCNQILDLDETTAVGPYQDDVLPDVPVMYLRLQEQSPPTPVPGGTAADAMGNHDGIYERAGSPLPDDPATLSPGTGPILLQLGIGPGLVPADTTATTIRVRGGRVAVPHSPVLNAAQFTLEAIVLPEWDLSVQGRYYAVFESTNEPAGGGNQPKRLGYALYAGPADPTTPNTPYRWQLWVGNGTDFRQLKEQPPADPDNPGTLVSPRPAYLGVRFDGSAFDLFVYTADSDIDLVKCRLEPQPYVPNANDELTIGMAGRFRSLVAPFPGPPRSLYPFIGRLQEITIYDKALREERIASHAAHMFFA